MNRRSFLYRAMGSLGGVLLLPAASSGAIVASSVRPGFAPARNVLLLGKAKEAKKKPGSSFPNRTARGESPALPAPRLGDITVDRALRARRSRRRYTGSPLGIQEISALLFAAQGITRRSGGWGFRTAPSAGALYPFDIYLFAHNLSGLAQGLYRYDVGAHGLVRVRDGDFRRPLAEACLYQPMVSDAAAVLAMAAVFARTTKKYGERGRRYVHIEAGCICQNIYLAAESMGLGTVAVGAFSDDRLNDLLGLDGVRQAAILVQPVGRV